MKTSLKALLALILIFSFAPTSFADVTIYGRGSAHGVGASMAGVYGMAKAGKTYQQIVPYYYPNTAWNTRNDSTVIRAKCQKHGNWVNIKVKDYLSRLAEEPDSWPTEGLRSLMVASRTYLWYKIERYGEISGGQYFVHDLNLAVRPNIVQAVKDTSNKVLTYNNKAIVAAYSGSAGGYTAKMSDVWGGSDYYYPYLVNRDSPYDSVFPSTFKWQQTVTLSQLQNAYPSIGSFQKLSIIERTSYDLVKSRVKTVKITGTNGSVTDNGWNFKGKVGLKSNYFYLSTWPSTQPPDTYKPRTYAPYKRKVKKYSYVRLYYKVKDPFTDKAYIIIKIKKRSKTVKTLKLGWKAVGSLRYYRYRVKIPRGKYKFYVLAKDRAGNPQYNVARNYLVVY